MAAYREKNGQSLTPQQVEFAVRKSKAPLSARIYSEWAMIQ